MPTVYKPNVREHPLARMERQAAGIDDEMRPVEWAEIRALLWQMTWRGTVALGMTALAIYLIAHIPAFFHWAVCP